MLHKEMVTAYSEIQTKHINTLVWAHCTMFSLTTRGTYSNHCAIEY
jgi:hypothetical protein